MDEIVELINGFGYEFDFEDRQGKKRYSKENGFLDLWHGKKGITIGVYNSNTKHMVFKRRPTLSEIEQIFNKIN